MNVTWSFPSRALAASLWLSSVALAGCNSAPMAPAVTHLGTQMQGASEVPPTMSAGIGTVDATLNPATNLLTWTVTYSGLTGPATAAHFHGPAAMGKNAPVAVPITGNLASPISGSATLTAAQAADLSAGRWYVNVHTAANPGGEIRGQVSIRP